MELHCETAAKFSGRVPINLCPFSRKTFYNDGSVPALMRLLHRVSPQ